MKRGISLDVSYDEQDMIKVCKFGHLNRLCVGIQALIHAIIILWTSAILKPEYV